MTSTGEIIGWEVTATPIRYSGRLYWDWWCYGPSGKYLQGVSSSLVGALESAEQSMEWDLKRLKAAKLQFRIEY